MSNVCLPYLQQLISVSLNHTMSLVSVYWIDLESLRIPSHTVENIPQLLREGGREGEGGRYSFILYLCVSLLTLTESHVTSMFLKIDTIIMITIRIC